MTWNLCTTRHGACWRAEVDGVVLACWEPTATRATWQWIVTSPEGREVRTGETFTLMYAQLGAEHAARDLGLICQVCGQSCPISESHLCERCARIERAS